MAIIAEEDKKLLETLGLSDIPEEEKQVVLEEIDNKMTRRFIANLLVSLEPDKARELEAEVQNIPSQNTQEIIEKIIAKHPDATKVLQDSAKEIMDELQKKDGGKQGVGSERQGAGRKEWGAGEETANQYKPAPQAPATTTTPAQEPTKTDMSDLGSFARPAEEVPAEPAPFASVATPDKPQASSEPVAKDKLPVPQEEPASPFGSEIKIVKDDEPTPNVIAPSPEGQDLGGGAQGTEGTESGAQGVGSEEKGVGSGEKDLGGRTQGAGEEATNQDAIVPEAPATPSSDLNPFTADKPEPSALESATAAPTGQPILPDSQAQPSDETSMPAAPAINSEAPDDSPAAPVVIPDEPADAPIVTPAASPSTNTPADITTSPATAPNTPADSTDSQPPQANQQTGASDYYQP